MQAVCFKTVVVMTDYASDLNHAARYGDDIVTAGQPTQEQLAAAAREGVQTVINLRPDGEFNEYDEARTVAEAGMRYVVIPVAGPGDINETSARQLDDALAEGTPALVHCASSNRVGALMAYRARYLHDTAPAQALQIGLDTGLNPSSPLLDAMRDKLGLER